MFNWIIESIIPAPQLDIHQNPTPPEQPQPKVQLQKSPDKAFLTEEPLDFRALSGQVTKQANINMKGVKKSTQKQAKKSYSSSENSINSLQNLQNLSDRNTTTKLSP